jgi:hypothetical protein
MVAFETSKAVIPLTLRATVEPFMEVACRVVELKIGIGEGVGVEGLGVAVGLGVGLGVLIWLVV